MEYTLLRRIIGGVVFLFSLIILFMTVQPSVSFWDCGEFIAASYSLQVPHPPGAPFFLLIGRIFTLLPFVENLGLRVNFLSVLASGLSIFFLYHVAVKLIQNYRGKLYSSAVDAVFTFCAAAIGALSFAFSDTFWFSAVEAEVYASSQLMFSVVMYLILRWNERSEEPGNEKYLLLIAYMIGLSTGVHLMAVLSIVTVVMIVAYKKVMVDEEMVKKSSLVFLGNALAVIITAVIVWGMQTSNKPPDSPEAAGAFDKGLFLGLLFVTLVIVAIFRKYVFSKSSLYFPMLIGGIALFVTYPGIVKYFPKLMHAIAQDNITVEIVLLALLFGGLGYLVYYANKNKKALLHFAALAFIFVFIGFTPYAMVIIRANLDPPMNENEPKTFSELVPYLGRDQYGSAPTFKRRYTNEPNQGVVYSEYKSDLDFWWRYQMNHMMTRYWLWNFAGRESWDQDSGSNAAPFNTVWNALGKIVNVRFSGGIKDSLFALPFLIGLLGIYFHFKKDWKMATAFMVLFILMGYLTAFYQNQQQPQPRERDYFYVGAFFVFAAWIALGVQGLADAVRKGIKSEGAARGAVSVLLIMLFLLVPLRMLQANYYSHDRSRNWVAWDYAYNLLQSCAPNAVLFTNGDNDTFPLWYLQDVEGVRRDIRIANLSLINTPWYVLQLKNLKPYGAKKVAMTLSDMQIGKLQPMQWAAKTYKLAVPDSIYERMGIPDSLRTPTISYTQKPTGQYNGMDLIRIQDIVVRSIIEGTNWSRPIYFAITASDDARVGLDDYLIMEGMALRLVPTKRKSFAQVDENIMRAQLFKKDDSYSKTYQPGFLFRGLSDSTIFFDDNHTRLMANYRTTFLQLAYHYYYQGKKNEVKETLNRMFEVIPESITPVDPRLMFDIANLYFDIGETEKSLPLYERVEKWAKQQIEIDPTGVSSSYNPYRLLLNTYENTKQYGKAVELLTGLKGQFPQDTSIDGLIAKFKKLESGDSVATPNANK